MISPQARTPEYTLAGSLKEQKVDLTCDPTVQYTVKRRYLERPGQRFKKKKNGKLALTPEAHALKLMGMLPPKGKLTVEPKAPL